MSAIPVDVLATAIVEAERQSRNWVGPGLLGFVVIVGLGVATFLLWRNMNKQIRKVDFNGGAGRSGSEPDGNQPPQPPSAPPSSSS